MANTVQLNYQEMNAIMSAMANQQAIIASSLNNTRNMMESIHNNTWIGQAADKFYDEMTGFVLPNLDKIAQGLGQAQDVAKQVIAIYSQADEETKGFFRGIV